MNFKKLAYKTEWIEYPDIEGHCKKLGIEPTKFFEDGRPPLYTLPAIHDLSTGVKMADSQPIVEYLEKTYPEAPTLFPHNTLGLQTAFEQAYIQNSDAIRPFFIPSVWERLNPPSQEYFRRTREARIGKKLEDWVPQGEDRERQWALVKNHFDQVEAWYSKNGGTGPFLMGETVTWADLVVAGSTLWLKIIWGENHPYWKEIEVWHGGRWKKLIDALEIYSVVV